MNAGKVNGWWVVATAAALIAFDLATEPGWRLTVFIMLVVMLSIIVFPLWAILKEEV
jgi:hypothetical protein